MKLVYIEWQDSYVRSSSWRELGDDAAHVATCKSVGWLLHEGNGCKVVLPHVSGPTADCPLQGVGEMAIPTKAIVRMVELREPARAAKRRK